MSPAMLVRLLPLSALLLSHEGSGAGHAAAGRIASTEAMSVARMAHTASVLRDGRVLVAGGFTGDGNAARSAELFDPASGTFGPLARMVVVRHSHSATILPNGKVLIVGGYGAGNEVIADVELFDPATRTFTRTGSLGSARAGHVAVLLGNGRVLIAGGVGPGWTFLSSAELYDPVTGRFRPTGPMTERRESHAAVMLRDGRVLVVGGHRDRRSEITLYASAETYDAATGTFTRAGDMRVRRHKHDAVLLRDGRVLITGGSDERDDGEYDSTEFFDPTTGSFAPGPTMRLARYKHTGSSILLPSGDVLIAGGAPQAEVFDPRRGAFTLVEGDGPLTGQFSAVASLGAGGVLITGGYGRGSGPRAAAWVYRP
ncbi:MAG: hypothetical protein K8S21_01940 [Gemmatimonadetes bacterium]|nr:hypothetical protein [Gemmatimonadota bacterium]